MKILHLLASINLLEGDIELAKDTLRHSLYKVVNKYDPDMEEGAFVVVSGDTIALTFYYCIYDGVPWIDFDVPCNKDSIVLYLSSI